MREFILILKQLLSMDPSHHQDIPVSAGIITVSSSRKETDDRSGAMINDLLTAASIPVSSTRVVTDSIEQIRSSLIQALETCNCVILTGGTGITSDDWHDRSGRSSL